MRRASLGLLVGGLARRAGCLFVQIVVGLVVTIDPLLVAQQLRARAVRLHRIVVVHI